MNGAGGAPDIRVIHSGSAPGRGRRRGPTGGDRVLTKFLGAGPASESAASVATPPPIKSAVILQNAARVASWRCNSPKRGPHRKPKALTIFS